MKAQRCPHCGEAGFVVGKLPREVVAIMACQNCNELSVLFRKTIIPLNRQVLESGTFDERKDHLATVITHFLEAGVMPFEAGGDGTEGAMFELPQRSHRPRRRRKPAMPEEPRDVSITDQELDRFIRVDLKCIDNPAYFRKIFG